MSTSLFSKTPSVGVLDNRGLTVRELQYCRHPDTPDVTRERITRHQYDARGFLMQSADPRLHDAGLANFTYLTDLAGNVLRAQGVDNGTTVSLNDAAGRPFIAVSNIRTADDGTEDRSQTVTRTWQYEHAELPGRPVSITEQVSGEAGRIAERFVYAGNTDADKALNLAGICVSHYDTAGLTQTDSVALTGVSLSVTRLLLKEADNPDVTADWQGADASAWNDLLADESERHTTRTTADATGAVLTTTDAKGNLQRVAYDVAGLLKGSWLTLKDGAEQVIVKSMSYSAAGQKLHEVHGNGVVTTYIYEAETHRLTGMKTERPAGHASGMRVLQDLRYDYDPVGNVLKVRNDAEETRFWRNQKVVPENTYTYDSLYQLVSATGREMADAAQQGSNLPATTVPLPTDSSAYTSYTRTYTYDSAGNLTQIRHSAPATNNSYTTNVMVSDRSNRGVLSTLTENAAEVEALFTAGGQQKQLQPGQTLVWTPRNELLKVTPVVRDGGADDRESYRYDAGSQRILKVRVQNTGSSTQTQRTLYLPGLELRTKKTGETETGRLQVITVGESGRSQVRVLWWEAGKPQGPGNGQVRYSYDTLTGSSGLELDEKGLIISQEEYYPYGGTAVWAVRSVVEADYKTVRYSGKERDATGLYYYGYRYYQPWAGRWLSTDPAGTVDGLNLFRMVQNNPVTMQDIDGLAPSPSISIADRIRKLQLRNQAEESSPSQSRPVFMGEQLLTPPVSITNQSRLTAHNVSSKPTPDLAMPVAENITKDGMKKFILYRADGRTFEELKNKYPEGFKAWVPLNTDQARKLASIFTGSKDTTGLPKHLIDNINKWGASPKLADLSTYIKYTKDRSTVWVSTAINTEAGGQSSGAPLYEISMELFESKIVNQKAVLAPEGRKKNMEFSLLTDNPDISQSSIIALNHGPLGDEEISFITRIPLSNVKPYSARR